MKRKLRSLLSLALSLALTLTLAMPALAYEDTDPPQWEQRGYSSVEEILEDYGITEEEYYEWFAAPALEEEKVPKEWIAAHPDQAAAFDPYAYFAQDYGYYYDSPQEYMEAYGLDEEAFRQDMLEQWAYEQSILEAGRRELEDFIAAYPAEYAAFDPYAYFEQEHPYYGSPEQYMEWFELSEEDFRQEMLEEWMWEVQYLAQEKQAVGGRTDGINVMVNGRCIPFPDALPEVRDGRTMVPMAAVLEYIGAQTAYDRIGHTATVALGEQSFTHTIATNTLTTSGGEILTMDVPSYIQDGRTMVPLAFFAQALGYEVFWDGEYQTAVLLDRQGAAQEIDSQFTLLNRILYSLSGGEQRREGQALESALDMELVITLLDSIKGDKKYTATLDGSTLTGDTAASAKYTASLDQLIDLYLQAMPSYYLSSEERRELEGYKKLLSGLSVEIIADMEGQCLYVRSPLLAQLGLVKNAKAWAALPVGGLLDAQGAAPVEPTLGSLLVAVSFADPNSPFHAWGNAAYAASSLLEVVGDGCFTRSGSSYTIRWSLEDFYPYAYIFYSDAGASFDALLKLTPSGERSCTYSLTMEACADVMTFDLALTGSPGKADLEMNLHVKNSVKAALEMAVRITATSRQPLDKPPGGDSIEHPAGLLGTGWLD